MNKLFVIVAAMFAMTTVASAEVFIHIDKSEQRMYVETPLETYEWDVSTGRKGYRTPSGQFQPYHMTKMHYSRKYDNAPMPHSIFFHGGYAIHATDAVDKLGRPASHGCIRLSPQNAKWLYRLVQEFGKENTYIEIVE
jgi:lipoprotein-anchoring transpeptidase ErfK/SrfK